MSIHTDGLYWGWVYIGGHQNNYYQGNLKYQMSFELLKTLLFFITGGFLIFLAITITRDNYTNRLNRITGSMLFFSAMGPIFIGIASVLDPAMVNAPNWESTAMFKTHYIWEM